MIGQTSTQIEADHKATSRGNSQVVPTSFFQKCPWRCCTSQELLLLLSAVDTCEFQLYVGIIHRTESTHLAGSGHKDMGIDHNSSLAAAAQLKRDGHKL